MSFKKFSSAQVDSGKNGPGDKSKGALGAKPSPAQPDKTPSAAAPAPKS